jgi:anti-anti-sigma regulatory factor
MLIIRDFALVVANDADGGFRLRPTGELDDRACLQLNEAIIGALRSGAPRLEVDLGEAGDVDGRVARVLRAGAALARHLDVEFRVTGASRRD